jgi:hypothetical protein
MTIRVTVQDGQGRPLDHTVTHEIPLPPASTGSQRRPEVEDFLTRARSKLNEVLLGPESLLSVTAKPRKVLIYWLKQQPYGTASFRIHFGGWTSDVWSPIDVAFVVEATDAEHRQRWQERLSTLVEEGKLPGGTQVSPSGERTVSAGVTFPWSETEALTDNLLDQVCSALLHFHEVTIGPATEQGAKQSS